MTTGQYNMRNPAVKRLMKEAAELREPTELYFAQPLEDNLFEWHFSVRGPPDTEFSGGIYHGRIILPTEYPMKPPSIYLLTPNGRFEINKKICLSISGHHPESWQPSWSIRTALLAIIGFMPTHGGGAIGSLDYTPEERKKLARRSRDWLCRACSSKPELKDITEASSQTQEEAREIAKQISFKDEKEVAEQKQKGEKENDEQPAADGASSSPAPSPSVPTTTPPPDAAAAPSVRQRRSQAVAEAAQQSPPVPAAPSAAIPPLRQGQGGRGSLVLIVLVSLTIAALVLRRLFLMNEWRFHGTPRSDSDHP